MDRIRNTVVLLFVAAIPAAAPPLPTKSPEVCFTAGSVTYRLSANTPSPDFRVRIDNQAARPDMRVGLVDHAELADFALVDDVATLAGNPCRTAGVLKTVVVVAADKPADMTISLTRHADDAGLKLYVHSARVSHQDAAALFALMRHEQTTNKLAAYP